MTDNNKKELPWIEEIWGDDDNTSSLNKSVLLESDDSNIEDKTELTKRESEIFVAMKKIDQVLKSYGLKPLYEKSHFDRLKLRVSLDRKSRKEFVESQKPHEPDVNEKQMGSFLQRKLGMR